MMNKNGGGDFHVATKSLMLSQMGPNQEFLLSATVNIDFFQYSICGTREGSANNFWLNQWGQWKLGGWEAPEEGNPLPDKSSTDFFSGQGHGLVTPKFTKPKTIPTGCALKSHALRALVSSFALSFRLFFLIFIYINNYNTNYFVYPKTINYLIPGGIGLSAIYGRLTYGQYFEQRAGSLSMKQPGKASSKKWNTRVEPLNGHRDALWDWSLGHHQCNQSFGCQVQSGIIKVATVEATLINLHRTRDERRETVSTENY